jgi:hypothetical protein
MEGAEGEVMKKVDLLDRIQTLEKRVASLEQYRYYNPADNYKYKSPNDPPFTSGYLQVTDTISKQAAAIGKATILGT